MSSLRRTVISGDRARILHRHGSRRDAQQATKSWEFVPGPRLLGFVLASMLLVGASALAADLTGRVNNGTTKKAAAGDDVLLLATSGATEKESARAKTDSAGHFRLSVTDTRGINLVRVVHQGVAYDEKIQPNADFVAIQVYDVADKVDSVTAVMDVQRFETKSDMLEVKQLVTMHNASLPPRTLMNDRPFSIKLPPEAQVQSGLIQLEEGQPFREKPTLGDHQGEYYFHFPLRPGDTRFAVVYQLPYYGQAVFEPEFRDAQERFVVMLPRSMEFEPKVAGIFRPMPNVSPDNVQGTVPVMPGQTLAFSISGTGTLAELQKDREQAQVSETASHAGGMSRTPTSTSTPPKLPGPSQNHDGFVGIGLTIALASGVVILYLKRRSGRHALEY